MWEASNTLRSRFRRQMTWIQWPIHNVDVADESGEGGDGKADRHPCCTKSLELNIDALSAMVEHYYGTFCDVYKIQTEARSF